jgi:hypothetical protein
MKPLKPIAVIVVTLSVGLCAAGCSDARHVSSWTFARKARTQVTTVHDVDFLGVRQGRAYLSEWTYWPIVGPKTRLLWTEARALSPELLRELEAERAREELAAMKRPV